MTTSSSAAPPELPKQFSPADAEKKWYSFWLEGRYFEAKADSAKPPFTMVIPPPNVTSRLHIGHALGRTLEDILARWKRMDGFETLWVPGTDHAGIATQTVVEKHLMRTEGKRRSDYPREEFLKRIWAWKDECGATILDQTKRLGCSLDWSRTAFTMDAARSRSVMEVFKRLYDQGLIYRGNYICNWDPASQTALADDEVEYTEQDGFLWHLKYPFQDDPTQGVVVATTRPETMLGDVAVAVNPKDERYAHLIGKNVVLPLVNRLIPIIADDFVEKEFGSGAVKITPAHDPNDFQCGQRHGLPQINVMHPDGRINEEGGAYSGLDRFEARDRIVADLKAQGLLVKVDRHQNRVGKSYRSGAIIEPYLSLQWFVKIRPLADMATKAVREGDVRLVPKEWESTYFHWMDNVRDWCISRQLVWGHRIPVFYDRANPERMVCTRGEAPTEPGDWVQDNDVLDTWFSSWLWPLNTLGWPDANHPDLKKFYPTSVLVTGYDILFFWVARMIMAGYFCEGKRPFQDVVLHGLVYGKSFYREHDGQITYIIGDQRRKYDDGLEPVPADVKVRWEKMSKSKGNILDPNELIDEVGADALRYTLAALTTQGRRQIDLERGRIIGYRNFMNKLWNAARFTLMNVADLPASELLPVEALAPTAPEDRWILSRLARATAEMNEALEGFHFDRAASAIYRFVWDDFCDWYVELLKPRLGTREGAPERPERRSAQRTLVAVLEQTLRLFHPLCPFISEEIWQTVREALPGGAGAAGRSLPAFAAPSLCVAPWPRPQPALVDAAAEENIARLQEVVNAIRNVRGEMNVPPSMSVEVNISSAESAALDALRPMSNLLGLMVRAESVNFSAAGGGDGAALAAVAVVGPYRLTIPLPSGLRDAERVRLKKERDAVAGEVERTRAKLTNEKFTAKAPADVVEKERARLAEAETKLRVAEEKLATLGG